MKGKKGYRREEQPQAVFCSSIVFFIFFQILLKISQKVIEFMKLDSFELQVTKSSGSYYARVLNSPFGGMPKLQKIDFDLGAMQSDVTAFRQRSLGFNGQSRLGEILFSTLFTGQILKLYERSISLIIEGRSAFSSQSEQPALHINLDIDPLNAAEIFSLPWELISNIQIEREFLSLSKEVFLIRRVRSERTHRRPIRLPLRALVIASSTLEIKSEISQLEKLSQSFTPDRFVLEIVVNPTLAELHNRLSGPTKYHFLHYLGHGETDGLFLADDTGDSLRIDGHSFADLIKEHFTTVILCSCQSGSLAESPWSSLAPLLLEHGVSTVIGMQTYVKTDMAGIFSRVLYNAILRDIVSKKYYRLDLCITEARQDTRSLLGYKSSEWAIPIVFSSVSTLEPVYLESPENHLQRNLPHFIQSTSFKSDEISEYLRNFVEKLSATVVNSSNKPIQFLDWGGETGDVRQQSTLLKDSYLKQLWETQGKRLILQGSLSVIYDLPLVIESSYPGPNTFKICSHILHFLIEQAQISLNAAHLLSIPVIVNLETDYRVGDSEYLIKLIQRSISRYSNWYISQPEFETLFNNGTLLIVFNGFERVAREPRSFAEIVGLLRDLRWRHQYIVTTLNIGQLWQELSKDTHTKVIEIASEGETLVDIKEPSGISPSSSNATSIQENSLSVLQEELKKYNLELPSSSLIQILGALGYEIILRKKQGWPVEHIPTTTKWLTNLNLEKTDVLELFHQGISLGFLHLTSQGAVAFRLSQVQELFCAYYLHPQLVYFPNLVDNAANEPWDRILILVARMLPNAGIILSELLSSDDFALNVLAARCVILGAQTDSRTKEEISFVLERISSSALAAKVKLMISESL